MTIRTAATAKLELLEPYIGIWDTEGEVMAGPAGESVKFRATDTYEWLPGGYFMFHRFEAKMPEGNFVGIDIIGYNEHKGSYTMYSFDSQGNANVMEGQLEMDSWTFIGKNRLFTGGFQNGGKVFAGLWEKRTADGQDWEPWMEVKLNKVD